MVVAIFKRANRRKIEVDYILLDSWLTTIVLINRILNINKKVHVIGMYKYNSKLSIDGKEHSIKQIKRRKDKISRNRSLKLYYFQYIGVSSGA